LKDRNKKMASTDIDGEDEWVEDKVDNRMVSPV
jgi:hypothetical protein